MSFLRDSETVQILSSVDEELRLTDGAGFSGEPAEQIVNLHAFVRWSAVIRPAVHRGEWSRSSRRRPENALDAGSSRSWGNGLQEAEPGNNPGPREGQGIRRNSA
jgi:hypothetical protein